VKSGKIEKYIIMSRIGKKPIIIPSNVEVKIDGLQVSVKGQRGELVRIFRPEVKIELKENQVFVSLKVENNNSKKYWGLTRTLLSNMIEGVLNGYQEKLQIEGVGYRAEIEGGDINLKVGFSHVVKIKKPEGISFSVDKNIITVEGIEKEKVGLIAAKIRAVRPPEPYKGKGIRYVGEVVKKKVGKKVASAA